MSMTTDAAREKAKGLMLIALDEREREILRLRFGLDRGEPRTLDEVGEHFCLTRERIRQIEARAMSKLRHPTLVRGARALSPGYGHPIAGVRRPPAFPPGQVSKAVR